MSLECAVTKYKTQTSEGYLAGNEISGFFWKELNL